MDAIKEVLEFLDRHTGFAVELKAIMERPQWPGGWLTAHQFAEEMDRFQFWTGLRSRVPEKTRGLLLEHYLEQSAEDAGSGWKRSDNQFQYDPKPAETTTEASEATEAEDAEDVQRRRHGRVSCEFLSCQYGEVVNMSASGVMIKGVGDAEHTTGETIGLNLNCLDHKLTLTARVAWVDQQDALFLMGMEFIELTADQAQRIRELLPIAAAIQPVDQEAGNAEVMNWGK